MIKEKKNNRKHASVNFSTSNNITLCATFLKKLFRHNEDFRNSPSKQMNLFDCLCNIFFMENKY